MYGNEVIMDGTDAPPIPPKFHPPQSEVEVPQEESSGHLPNVTGDADAKTESHCCHKPSPAPRKLLQTTTKNKCEKLAKPVPKPRNLHAHSQIVDNPVYFTVNIRDGDNLAFSNEAAYDEDNDDDDDDVVDITDPEFIERRSKVPPEDLVLEFDPFAPGRDMLSVEQASLHLTGSVFALDTLSDDASDMDGLLRSKTNSSVSIAEEGMCVSPPLSPTSTVVSDPEARCRLSSSSEKIKDWANLEGESTVCSSSVVNSEPDVNVRQKSAALQEMQSNKKDSRLSNLNFAPPAFPPPPLPDGFSASTMSLLESAEFLESYEVLSKKSQPDAEASQQNGPVSKVTASDDEKPPLPPKSQSRSQTPELAKPRAPSPGLFHLTNRKPSSSLSSTESSPDLKHRQLTNSITCDKVPPPPPKSIEIAVKASRSAISPPLQPASSSDESAPPLPPKSRSHLRTKSWNLVDLISVIRTSVSSKTHVISPHVPQNVPIGNSRPELVNKILQGGFPHSGMLYKTGSNRKDFRQRWCVLEDGYLKYYTDEKAEIPQNAIHQKEILSIGKVYDVKNNNFDLSCFEVNTLKEKGRSYLFGAPIPSDRESWMEHISLSIAPSSCRSDTHDFIKAGYIYFRQGMTGTWRKNWMILRKRNLTVVDLNEERNEVLDLRKAMLIQMQSADRHQGCSEVAEEGPTFHIDFPGKGIYLQGHLKKETDSWYVLIRSAMFDIGDTLESHQLTSDDVPVIVEKCVTFVGVHGCTMEGIYRINGTKSKVSNLLRALKQDAWGFTLKPGDYGVHEVASVLKRYLRSLSEPLLTSVLYEQWLQTSVLENRKDKLVAYEKLLDRLPKINYNTLKCLINHLRSINDNSDTNLMTTNNLASIFGPTLMTSESDSTIPNLLNTNMEMDVVGDLINNYPMLFKVSQEELKRDLVIQKALIEMKEAKRSKKPAGDILIGVYVYNKEWGKCLNVRISPSMTAQDLCLYAMQTSRMKERLEHLTVFEVVSNGEMERPLHYSENVLCVTLQWARWADSEAKDNYLVIKKNEIYHTILPLARQPISMFSELRLADRKSKHFKKFLLEFKNARLSFYKDAKIIQPERTWNIEDIVWYIGYEQKRPVPTKWAFTFIDKKDGVKRTKDTPYFGWTVCCQVEEEFHKWIAAMLIGEYPNGLLPRKEHVDLLS